VNEIILQVFNHENESGGIDRSLQLDDGEITARREFNTYSINMIIVGLLLFGGVYNILFYFFRRENTASLYIGLTCLVWAVNTYNIQSPILSGSLSYPGNPFIVNFITAILVLFLIMMIVKSSFPDEFSTYLVRLSRISDSAFGNKPVFLVVDDDPVNVRVLQNCFESKQCVVKTATDGISALDIIDRDGSIDLVLLDIMMPAMSGYEVCRRIRMNRAPEDLPVIMLTAKNMMSDIDAAFEAGANDYIVKPFQTSELLARVGTMLKLRNIRKSAAQGITIRDRNRAYSLSFSGIIYITSHSKNIVIHTSEGDIEVPVLMKEIIHRLPTDMFIRIHKSHVINIQYVHSISHVLSGRYRVRLRDNDDTVLPVGPAFLESLRKYFNTRV